jgi:hypothetical protein
MNSCRRIGTYFLLCMLGYLSHPAAAFPQAAPVAAQTDAQHAGTVRDGQHDFDFELGNWTIHLAKLVHPLTVSSTWIKFDGTSVTRKVWDGRSQLEQFETDGAAGHIEGLTLRVYNPQSHQWSLYWANSKDGTLFQPLIGEFKNGRGEFYDQETFGGRDIYNRFIWSEITPNSAHFEQSFSDDGGKTWETNWITDQTRVPDEADKAPADAQQAVTRQDGQNDFDFNFGTWNSHISRLVHPLTGSTTWAESKGTVVVRKIWDGRAQLEEVEADGPSGHFEDLGLFLYNPESRQWSLSFANSKVGILGVPATVGEFKNGRGEFYDQEAFNGKFILVRIVWSDITPNSHRFEQSFSDDGGKTWEPNIVATLTRAGS